MTLTASPDQSHLNSTDARQTILEARGLTKSFRGFVAVDKVDLKIQHGGIHALIGPNGAGKTTVFNLLTRFIPPTSGNILLFGEDITRQSAHALARHGVVRSFQISATFPHLSVIENLKIAVQRPSVSPGRFWQSSRSLAHLEERAHHFLELVELKKFAQVAAGELPYGHKRALELATTLATDPKVMLLDEPTQGLGIEEVDHITQLIKRFSKERTVLMVEHNMRMVAAIADRISVLRYGRIIAEGSYDEVSRNPQVIEAYLGSKAKKENQQKNKQGNKQ
ncbi:MAG: ABC transporter ATP-binding protein [Xanthobacteraceae bacterium]